MRDGQRRKGEGREVKGRGGRDVVEYL